MSIAIRLYLDVISLKLYHLDLLHKEVDLSHLKPGFEAFWAEINTYFGKFVGIFKVFTF